MLCEYSYTKSESLVQIRTIIAEIQHFFLGDCFLLAHPVCDCIYANIFLNTWTNMYQFLVHFNAIL